MLLQSPLTKSLSITLFSNNRNTKKNVKTDHRSPSDIFIFRYLLKWWLIEYATTLSVQIQQQTGIQEALRRRSTWENVLLTFYLTTVKRYYFAGMECFSNLKVKIIILFQLYKCSKSIFSLFLISMKFCYCGSLFSFIMNFIHIRRFTYTFIDIIYKHMLMFV